MVNTNSNTGIEAGTGEKRISAFAPRSSNGSDTNIESTKSTMPIKPNALDMGTPATAGGKRSANMGSRSVNSIKRASSPPSTKRTMALPT